MGIIEKIAAAGIVGCGGAGFPSHKKLSSGIEYLIINGAECEPLLRTDRYIMLNKAPMLVRALSSICEELEIPNCVIALKHHYNEEICALKAAIQTTTASIRIHEMDSFYPAGDEQTIVYEVTGRVVPPGGIPVSVGAVVNNIATIYAISEALDDIPFTQKYLTVTGEVSCPSILRVPLGTSYRECLDLVGGTLQDSFFIVSGGPMMGKPIPMSELDTAVVTKTTSGILVLPADGYHAKTYDVEIRHMLNRARSACIQCTYCSQLCPRHMLGHPLEPHRIMRKMAMGETIKDLLEDPDIHNAQLCCECGICETYACPMGLFPRRINSMLKQQFGAAGIRYQATSTSWEANPHREDRKAPSERVAIRMGLSKYYNYEIKNLRIGTPTRVEIPVKMHIGAPSVPVVAVGDFVTVGTLIAQFPSGAMGAMIHASIDGYVKAIGETIVIIKE